MSIIRCGGHRWGPAAAKSLQTQDPPPLHLAASYTLSIIELVTIVTNREICLVTPGPYRDAA